MRKILLTFFIISLVATSCWQQYDYNSEQQRLLSQLDRVVERYDVYNESKVRRIEDIKSNLSSGLSERELYDLYDALYVEYFKYDIDSAITYARKKLAIAQRLSSQKKASTDAGMRDSLLCDAEFDLADRYVLSGMYSEVLDIVRSLDVTSFPFMLRPRFYHICNSLYSGLAESSDDPILRNEYYAQMRSYRKKLYGLLGNDDISKLYVWSAIEMDRGNSAGIIDSLLTVHSSGRLSSSERSVVSYIAAKACRQCGKDEEAIALLAESAINDLITPTKEYRSLYELAELLYQRGDFTRAYNYINRSITDAIATNARMNVNAINTIIPVISRSYDRLMRHRQNQILLALILMSIMAVMLVVTLCLLTNRRRKLSVANRQLKEYVALLQDSNDIRDSYLGRYMDMCSYYIGGLERYRTKIRKSAKVGLAEVNQELKSVDFINKELDEFYAQFDASFLDLFPDFVTQLNALLCEDKQLDVRSKEGILTTEVRVAALIRLGVTDSVKIAQFLRRSVSTIYNYRVKMRNAAKSSREDLEKQIMRIGRLS